MKIVEKDIEVNNIILHYKVMGTGKPLILLNPNSESTAIMLPVGKKFSKYFKVYLVDRRCCGKSTKNCLLNYEDSAKDIYEFIKKLNLDKPYVLGLSGGASTALFLAIMYPDSVSKLVLGSGVTRFKLIKFPKYTEFLRRFTFLPMVRKSEKFYKLNEEAKELTPDELSKIKVSTLVVNGGEKDIVPIDEANYLAENIKNSKLYILEKEGHCTYISNSSWYSEVIEFLRNY